MRSVWLALIPGLITMLRMILSLIRRRQVGYARRARRRLRSPVIRGKRCLALASDEGRSNGRRNHGRGDVPAITVETDPEHPSGLRAGRPGPDRARSAEHRSEL